MPTSICLDRRQNTLLEADARTLRFVTVIIPPRTRSVVSMQSRFGLCIFRTQTRKSHPFQLKVNGGQLAAWVIRVKPQLISCRERSRVKHVSSQFIDARVERRRTSKMTAAYDRRTFFTTVMDLPSVNSSIQQVAPFSENRSCTESAWRRCWRVVVMAAFRCFRWLLAIQFWCARVELFRGCSCQWSMKK